MIANDMQLLLPRRGADFATVLPARADRAGAGRNRERQAAVPAPGPGHAAARAPGTRHSAARTRRCAGGAVVQRARNGNGNHAFRRICAILAIEPALLAIICTLAGEGIAERTRLSVCPRLKLA